MLENCDEFLLFQGLLDCQNKIWLFFAKNRLDVSERFCKIKQEKDIERERERENRLKGKVKEKGINWTFYNSYTFTAYSRGMRTYDCLSEFTYVHHTALTAEILVFSLYVIVRGAQQLMRDG